MKNAWERSQDLANNGGLLAGGISLLFLGVDHQSKVLVTMGFFLTLAFIILFGVTVGLFADDLLRHSDKMF